MNKIPIALLFLLLLVACSPFQKALKSTDSAVKYEQAEKLYKKKKTTSPASASFEKPNLIPATLQQFYHLRNVKQQSHAT